MPRFIVLDAADNVAVAMEEAAKGANASLSPEGEIVLRDAVPFAHKVAIQPIAAGGMVIKYGQVIGQARTNIAVGDYVHVHNIKSFRNQVA